GRTHAATDEAASGYGHSATLRSLLRSAISEHPQDWQTRTLLAPTSLFGRYARDPNGVGNLLDALFSNRNTLYFGFIISTVKKSFGAEPGLSLIENVATEHGTTGIYGWAAYFLRNPSQLALGVTPN